MTSTSIEASMKPIEIVPNVETISNLEIFKQNARLLARLKLNLSEDSFYEAHQLFKTIHFRGMSTNLVDDCIELIYFGVLYFQSKNQINCSFDLSKVFIETLKKSTNIDDLEPGLIEKIKNIHSALRNGNEERNEFAVAILKWSGTLYEKKPLEKSKASSSSFINRLVLIDSTSDVAMSNNYAIVYQKKFGDFRLHQSFAMNLWQEKKYAQARTYFLHSRNAGSQFASMIIEYHTTQGYPSEVDLFLAQIVLQYLCLRNLETAQAFFTYYISKHPKLSEPSSTTKLENEQDQASVSLKADLANNHSIIPSGIVDKWPLINFINFLIYSIKNDKPKMFLKLKQLYKPSIDRDPSFADYLDRIGTYFFNLKSSKAEQGNLISNLMKMLVSPDQLSDNGLFDNNGDSRAHSMSNRNFMQMRGGGGSKRTNILDTDDDDEDDDEFDDEVNSSNSCNDTSLCDHVVDDTDILD